MLISYNWLKWYLPDLPSKLIQAGIPDAPPAEKLADIITYHIAEVESVTPLLVEEGAGGGDYIFEIKILPNRAHDLLSHMGMGRELASLLNISYTDPTPKYKIPESKPTKLKIEINTNKCRRDTARIVRNIKVDPSPEWMVKHLESIGQRSINNIVDATNIVMFDCGQPSHVFDMDKVKGPKLDIKASAGGEKIIFLGGLEKELQKGMVIIYDAEGNPIGTGVKGGTLAELDDNTHNIILQIDNFDPISVRKMGQALNIFTEGRKRFENDLSPELAPYAMRELSALIAEMCPGAIFEEVVDIYPEKQKERKLKFSLEKISKILGLKVTAAEVEKILNNYVIKYVINEDEFEITVPPYRLDLEIEEDMAEEIGRIMGYDKVRAEIPKINFKPKINEEYKKIQKVRGYLLSQGYSEVMTYVFVDSGEVEVMQSASDKKFLRTNLADGLKESLKLNKINIPLLGLKEVKIFEIGTVWNPNEEMHVAYNEKDKIMEKSLEEFAPPRLSDTPPSKGGEDNPPRLDKEGVGGGNFKMWSLYPFISRDISVWVPQEVESYQVCKVIKESAGELLIKDPELFDEFKKDGKVSYAFRLVFQSLERTLTDMEVNDIMLNIEKKIKEQDWQVR